jgi:subtilisin family serine protease
MSFSSLMMTAMLAPLFTLSPTTPTQTPNPTPILLPSDDDALVFWYKQPRTITAIAGLAAVRGSTPSAVAQTIPGWSLISSTDALARAAGNAPATFATRVFRDELGGPMFPTSRLLIALENPTARNNAASHAEAALAAVRSVAPTAVIAQTWSHLPGIISIETNLPTGDHVLAAAAALAQLPAVRFAEPDMVFTGSGSLIPNDPGFPDAWGLRNTGQQGGLVGFDMNVTPAWDITLGNASIITVIIDTGVAQPHPDLNLTTGFDATGQNGGGNPVNACDNHGTPVAGCVSAIINNNLGAVGVAPASLSASARTFISVSACNGGWNSNASWTVDTLNFAASIGARVTNNSNYYGFQAAAIADAYDTTRNDGMVHFAAAGNFSSSTITYPSSLPTVNAVAALARNGTRASFSNWGNGLDFSAPGVAVASTDRPGPAGYTANDYVFVNGTSFASPYTAGVAALLLSVYPSLSADRVEEILQLSARDLGTPGYDTDFGWGMPDAHRALLIACPADFNTDGAADFFDYLDFVAAFDAERPRADFNGDNAVDFFDYLDFVAAFELGCA